MDEPTSGIDSASAVMIMSLLKDVAEAREDGGGRLVDRAHDDDGACLGDLLEEAHDHDGRSRVDAAGRLVQEEHLQG